MNSLIQHHRSAWDRLAVHRRRSPTRRSRPGIAAGVCLATALAAVFLVAAHGNPAIRLSSNTAKVVLPGPESTPGVTVNFTSTVATDDPDAIGVDESTYGESGNATDTDANDPTAQSELRSLGLGYARIWLTLADPGNPDSAVVCQAAGCSPTISADTWITELKAMGMTPEIGIPDTLDAADAATIVQHFNDPALSTYDPVTYWVYGNEPDHAGAQNMTADAYSTAFNSAYDAMKAVDSSIKIGGPATAWYDSSFITTFLQDSGSRTDFIDFHFYPGNDTEAQLLAAPSELTSDLTAARTLISTYKPSRASDIAVHLGEYNMSYVGSVLDQYTFTGSPRWSTPTSWAAPWRLAPTPWPGQPRTCRPVSCTAMPGTSTSRRRPGTRKTRRCPCTRRSGCSPERDCSPASAPRWPLLPPSSQTWTPSRPVPRTRSSWSTRTRPQRP